MARPKHGQYLCTHCGKACDSIQELHEHQKACKTSRANEPLMAEARVVAMAS